MAKGKKGSKKERSERRFDPKSAGGPGVVKLIGALGSIAMGAGAYGQFVPTMSDPPHDPVQYSAWVLAGGAIVLGAAIWLGTSGEPSLRVGDPGVAIDKGSLVRIPWYAIDKIELVADAVVVRGKDDLGTPRTVTAKLATQPDAAAWIVKEARARVPDVVDIAEDASLPAADKHAGEVLAADPPQVVGKHCADTGRIIAYEPDARVCPRCDRVYHKASVPERCACGASLTSLLPAAKSA
jgi:hypothetical protein